MKHFTEEGSDYFGFRYGLLDRVHNFQMQSATDVKRLEKLIADPHAFFARDLTLRKFTIKDLKFLAPFQGLRQLKLDWSNIKKLRSIEPLASMAHLAAVHLEGSPVSDLG